MSLLLLLCSEGEIPVQAQFREAALMASRPIATKTTLANQFTSLQQLIQELEKQHQVSIAYRSGLLTGKTVTVDKIKSTKNLEHALAVALEGSGLSFKKNDEGFYIVYKVSADENEGAVGPASRINYPSNQTASSQQQIIKGVVKDDANFPLPGVSVSVKNSPLRTGTDEDGTFSLTMPAGSDTLVLNYMGFKPMEVSVGNRTSLEITLEKDEQALSEVVVTAFGVQREKKALGYVVQDIDQDKLNEVRTSNVTNALSGKLAGVRINSNAGPGSSSTIQIRGSASVSGNNQPLIVIDGVPIQQDGDNRYGGGISEVSPDNIQNISVLKGPNAAALYGSRATNGVILITTKDGSDVRGIGVDITSNTTFERPWIKPDFQNIYGGGTGYVTMFADGRNGTVTLPDGTTVTGTAGVDESWGAPLDGRLVPQWWSNGERVPLVPQPNNWDDFWQTGHMLNNNVALGGSNDKGNFRLSIGDVRQKGIAYNNDYHRNNFKFNGGYHFTDKLHATISTEYVKSGSDNRRYQSGQEFIWSHRHIDHKKLQDLDAYTPSNVIQPAGQYFPYANWQYEYFSNPYYVQEHWKYGNDKDRLLGNIALHYDFTDWLTLMVRGGTDFWSDTRTNRIAEQSALGYPNGAYSEEVLRQQESNFDFLLGFNKTFGDVQITANAGGVHRDNYYKRNFTQINDLAVNNVWNLGNYASPPVTESAIEKSEVNSLLASANIGYKNAVFLDLTARNDWSSTLPADHRSFFYPSASLSMIFTDMLPIKSKLLSFAKGRLSVAEVGSDTQPYQLLQTFESKVLWDGRLPAFGESITIANPLLKPEITRSFEAGLDLRFVDDRLGLDLTFYNQNTRDQILGVEISKASGYNYRLLNAGKVSNQGFEVVIHGTPFKTPTGFTWDIDVNWARNRNKVVELAEGLTTYTLENYYVTLEARVGEPYGTFYGTYFERAPDGQIVYENGLPILGDGTKALGSIQPDWTGGVLNSFSFKNFSLSFLVDMRYGGKLFDNGTGIGRSTGQYSETAVGREEGVIGRGVMNIGTVENPVYVPNDVIADASPFYKRNFSRTYHEAGVFDATYVKLRELSFGYTLPAKWLDRTGFIKRAKVSLVGRNLAMLFKNTPHIDPEVDYFGNNSQGFAYGNLPSTRNVGFNLNVSF